MSGDGLTRGGGRPDGAKKLRSGMKFRRQHTLHLVGIGWKNTFV